MREIILSERSDFTSILNDYDYFYNNAILNRVISSIPNIFLILNKNRQIVFCNDVLLQTLKLDDKNLVLGLRPGEVFNCIYSSKLDTGCGTTEFCKVCGAFKAITQTQTELVSKEYECKMLTMNEDKIVGLTLKINTNIIELENDYYITFHIININEIKRKKTLENLLFNEIKKNIDSTVSLLDIIKTPEINNNKHKYLDIIQTTSLNISEEIQQMQEIDYIENGNITPNINQIHSLIFLLDIVKKIMNIPSLKNKNIYIDQVSTFQTFSSDKALLEKALKNLIINALEYSPQDEEVKIGCYCENEKIKFWIRNNSSITPEIKLQIFQKSFSTSRTNRGYGTYLSKLIVENILNGKIFFESNLKEGTTFIIELPINF
ncbi:MAG TPA: HAMP domain-containing sensor histidine kinase [Ignavibacteria bacterium]